LPQLSTALWGSHRYPYIFFFRTERLSLTWGDFLEHTDFAPHFDPRGQFLSVADTRLQRFGGTEAYVDFLRARYGLKSDDLPAIPLEEVKNEIPNITPEETVEVLYDLDQMLTKSLLEEPTLTDDYDERAQVSQLTRDAAFRLRIRQIYNASCAVCNRAITTPDGLPEVQSAHIHPKSLRGSDDLRNGICLCRMHHWAFDSGWMTVSDDHLVQVRDDLPLTSDYDFIRSFAGKKITLPSLDELAPHPIYLQSHRKLHGFKM
jgi:putative restriction endonuclease